MSNSNSESLLLDLRKFRGVVRCVATASVLSSMICLMASDARTQIRVGAANNQQTSTPEEWKAVEKAIGKTGSVQPGGVFKIGLPRTDLNVIVRGVQVNPVLALGSWIAFKKMGSEAFVMGDLVLTEAEVGPVMWSLQESGIDTTALHNHVLDEWPRVMYMHIHGHGDAVKLAAAIRRALSYTKTPFDQQPSATLKRSQPSEIDFHQVELIVGRGGKDNNGVYQFSIARAEKIIDGEMEVPPSMGVATAINFQTTGEGRAAITGDFVLIAGEVNPVIHALRENGIAVTAIHSHMLTESPRLFFMHFWANDDALKLARGLHAALDKTNSAK
ncbi:MAG TPA: DUF1259 domain-containing protein [Pyrinomonadaceae bacterium]|nr:DUF1259 domain-containing protein [Pyrinomonadaceae bacterium]